MSLCRASPAPHSLSPTPIWQTVSRIHTFLYFTIIRRICSAPIVGGRERAARASRSCGFAFVRCIIVALFLMCPFILRALGGNWIYDYMSSISSGVKILGHYLEYRYCYDLLPNNVSVSLDRRIGHVITVLNVVWYDTLIPLWTGLRGIHRPGRILELCTPGSWTWDFTIAY